MHCKTSVHLQNKQELYGAHTPCVALQLYDFLLLVHVHWGGGGGGDTRSFSGVWKKKKGIVGVTNRRVLQKA